VGRAGRAAFVSELPGTLEGKEAQLVLSYIVCRERHPIYVPSTRGSGEKRAG